MLILWFFIWMAGSRTEINGSSSLRPLRPASMPVKRFQRSQIPRQLLVTAGPLAGSRMNLDNQGDITIGRSEKSAFVLGDDFASAQHARLINREGAGI